LGHPAFATEFRNSETQAFLLEDLPVSWISNQEAGLWGAAIFGLGAR
jgi:glucokinase